MTIYSKYFCWLVEQIGSDIRNTPYLQLLEILHDIEFYPTIKQDNNRRLDGLNLRTVFLDDYPIFSPEFKVFDERECTVLEMMVALARRIEDSIMEDESFGDRTHIWFWYMVESIGIDDMDDQFFNRNIVENAIKRCLERDFLPNGSGSFFYIQNPKEDMRDVEIWFQMSAYLNEYIAEEEDYFLEGG